MAEPHPIAFLSRQPQAGLLAADNPGVLERVFAARGVRETDELDRPLSQLLAPNSLVDIDVAAARLVQAVVEQEPILIVGDFDADGATSVTLGVSLLAALGAGPVDFLVPNRFEFGYGLSEEIVQLAATRNPKVIITVDNGVSSIAGVDAANELGIDVIVTDHHLPGADLPRATAVVNPNRRDCAFPSKAIAGVGVIFYVLGRVRAMLEDRGWFEQRTRPHMADWLDLVALGTVADVVPLDRNNRILVYQGLQRIRSGRCRPGIRALCEIAGRDPAKLSAQDLGYALGPRLNAAGRLDDMSIGIRCLLAGELKAAKEFATALDELNRARREIENTMVGDAELMLAGHDLQVGDRYGVCVFDPSWHQGVVGIVAGRLKDRVHRPVIAFAPAGDMAPDELKGSARSIPALHIRDALDAIAARYPGMISKFGGHAMAAGMSIKQIHYERFAKAFDAQARSMLPAEALEATVVTDGALQVQEFTLETARNLTAAGPWGQGFPEPLFQGEFMVVSQRVVGERHLKLVVQIDGLLLDAIAFRQAPLAEPGMVELVFHLAENDYREPATLQLIVEHLRSLA
jgi:single-stranded-DNA-specific exonuclease